MSLQRRVASLSVIVAAVLVAGCDPSPGDVREWTAADHAQEESRGKQAAPRPSTASDDDAEDDLIALAWQRNCARCHGEQGRGDGPEGPMVKASDLTNEAWQARVTDDDIALAIRKGKDKMPAFDLPAQVVTGLVARIRAGRARP